MIANLRNPSAVQALQPVHDYFPETPLKIVSENPSGKTLKTPFFSGKPFFPVEFSQSSCP
jgi:hypothetical protein